MPFLYFFTGMIVGGCVGIFVMALVFAARSAEDMRGGHHSPRK